MLQRLRRRAPSSRRTGPATEVVKRRLRAGAALALPLALVVVGLTGTAALGSPAFPQAGPPAPAGSPAPRVSSLTTQDMTDPLGIDASQPVLGWVVTSAARGVSQGKY